MLVPLVHMQSQHEVYRFYCDQCDYKAATKGNMNVHKQAKHEGIQYSCDQRVIQLDCDQCEYKATQKFNLRMHIQLKHIGIVYSCDHTSMLLGFINNQYTKISNLIVNNVSTKQQKRVI